MDASSCPVFNFPLFFCSVNCASSNPSTPFPEKVRPPKAEMIRQILKSLFQSGAQCSRPFRGFSFRKTLDKDLPMINSDLFMGRIWLIRMQTCGFPIQIEEILHVCDQKDSANAPHSHIAHTTASTMGTPTNRKTHTSQAIRQKTPRGAETREKLHSQASIPRDAHPKHRAKLYHKSNRQMERR